MLNSKKICSRADRQAAIYVTFLCGRRRSPALHQCGWRPGECEFTKHCGTFLVIPKRTFLDYGIFSHFFLVLPCVWEIELKKKLCRPLKLSTRAAEKEDVHCWPSLRTKRERDRPGSESASCGARNTQPLTDTASG